MKMLLKTQQILEKGYGMYGDLRKEFLFQNRKETWQEMLEKETLDTYLTQFQQEMQAKADRLEAQMTKTAGLTEQLKQQDVMAYMGRLNNLQSQVMEIMQQEIRA